MKDVGYFGWRRCHKEHFPDYVSFHSLAGWITYTHRGWLPFKGDKTMQLVDLALVKTFGEPQSPDIVYQYYQAVRRHKANSTPINLLVSGNTVLSWYEELLCQSYDFDDVIWQATWHLANNPTNRIHRLRFNHLVLIDTDFFKNPDQKHLQLFYSEFAKWCRKSNISISNLEGVPL